MKPPIFLQPVLIYSQADLHQLAQEMQQAAKANHIQTDPGYSATPEEANLRALITIDQTFSSGQARRALFVQDRAHISLTLTIDAFEEPKQWHLSIGMQGAAKQPNRVPDSIAIKIVGAFFKEGCRETPSEGVFLNVRHFKQPYQPD